MKQKYIIQNTFTIWMILKMKNKILEWLSQNLDLDPIEMKWHDPKQARNQLTEFYFYSSYAFLYAIKIWIIWSM